MVMQCSYCGKKADSGRTFHQFPLKQPELLKSWLKNVNVGDHFEPSKSMRLCSDHFTAQCFQKTGVNVIPIDGSVSIVFGTYRLARTYCSFIKMPEDNLTLHR
ncbi:THAP domain-containing protein 1 B-like [Athalia rosae]|uniref:THAP domain-containing protein 1 B-like n=1 Tax=Athalia rosae TaxID=37344 RepID=UPI002033BED1|nr:THAP domain-containing protein 1 B-like [Athalia rosae]